MTGNPKWLSSYTRNGDQSHHYCTALLGYTAD